MIDYITLLNITRALSLSLVGTVPLFTISMTTVSQRVIDNDTHNPIHHIRTHRCAGGGGGGG